MRIRSIAISLALPLLVMACGGNKPPSNIGLNFVETSYSDLSGWQLDDQSAALEAFLLSCESLLKQPASRPMKGVNIAGTVGDWQPACEVAMQTPKNDAASAREYFEQNFKPVAVTLGGNSDGLFTGYYEPLLRGSFEKGGKYQYPLYKKPEELVAINLGDFRPSLKGQSLVGVVKGGQLVPYYDRETIEAGALKNKDLELLWVDDLVDAFFLQVQGSGRVQLENGDIVSVGYAGKNGHVYRSIGRILIDEGALDLETMSLQTLRTWLDQNPDQRDHRR